MTNRVFNFGAGPSMMPEAVLDRARADMLDWRHSGMSPMEVSHRSNLFQDLLIEIQQKCREIFSIPSHYQVLFLAGGAQGQFAAVPLNLTAKNSQVDYLHSGVWSGLAVEEAQKYAQVNVAASGQSSQFFSFPEPHNWQLNPEAAYFYYCVNETITGLRLRHLPSISVPIVADMTSCFGAENFDINQYGIVFSSAQKNLGQAGVTIVIVREDLLDLALPTVPGILHYAKQAKADSCVNTPPTYAIYILGLMLDWMKEQGGLLAIEKMNQRKAKLLYDYLETTDFYQPFVDPAYRSIINVSFRLANENQTSAFVSAAEKAGLVGLKGHKKLGGIRASLYNAITEKMVEALVSFMKEFAAKAG